MLVGLIPRFDMDGVAKELAHSRNKASLIGLVVKQLKGLVQNTAGIVFQVNMEDTYFP